jgi:hypothetical protein
MGSYSIHQCDTDGAPLGALDGPAWADPGRPVHVPETGLYGRVRLVWRCCGAYLVEFMDDPDDAECATTHTVRVRLAELAPPPGDVMYSIPCIGAAWSLNLPCGHLNGEGCDCDTIAAEADDQASTPDDGPCTVEGCVADTHCYACARHTSGDKWCADCATT